MQRKGFRVDWKTGEVVQRAIFGQDNLGHGAYALVAHASNGDLPANGIGGTYRAHLGG